MSEPYTTPQTMLQPDSGMPVLEPKAIKTFGILHIVFGFIGVFFTIVGVVFIFLMKPFFNWLGDQMGSAAPPATPGAPAAPDPGEVMRLMGEMYSSQMPYYILSSVVSFVLVVFLLRAGFSLVKKKKPSAQRSNFWAWLTIGYLVLSLPIGLYYSLPAQREMQEKLNESLGVPAAAMNTQAEMVGQIVGTIFGFVVSIVYPILALYFLRRKTVSDYLERYGT